MLADQRSPIKLPESIAVPWKVDFYFSHHLRRCIDKKYDFLQEAGLWRVSFSLAWWQGSGFL